MRIRNVIMADMAESAARSNFPFTRRSNVVARVVIRVLLSLLAFCSCASTFGGESASQQTLAIGVFASEGDYGESASTTMLALPVSYKVSYAHWNFRLATALVRIQGPGNVDLASVPAGGATRTQVETGIGDVFLSASRIFSNRATNVWWEPYGKVKIPTGDNDKGLGTGEFDGEFGAELSRRIGAASFAFTKVAYRWRGDLPEVEINDGLSAGLAWVHAPKQNWSGGVMLDYRQAATSTSSAAREITLLGTHRLSTQHSVTVYLIGGLSDASPNIGGGFQFQSIFK